LSKGGRGNETDECVIIARVKERSALLVSVSGWKCVVRKRERAIAAYFSFTRSLDRSGSRAGEEHIGSRSGDIEHSSSRVYCV